MPLVRWNSHFAVEQGWDSFAIVDEAVTPPFIQAIKAWARDPIVGPKGDVMVHVQYYGYYAIIAFERPVDAVKFRLLFAEQVEQRTTTRKTKFQERLKRDA